MSILFTNSNNLTKQFTDVELDRILSDLNGQNGYYQSSQDGLVFVRISDGYLLMIDLNDNTNRKLFELFTFSFASDNVHTLKLIQNNSANEFTIDQALLSVGYSGTIPLISLEDRFMKLYIKSGSNVDVYSKDETNVLLSQKQDTIHYGDLSISHVNSLQTVLDTKAEIANVYNKADIELMITNLIDNADTNLNTLNEIANAINNDPLFYQKVASIQGLESLIRPTDSAAVQIKMENSEGSYVLSNDNQTFGLAYQPSGSQFSLSGFTYNQTNGLIVNNKINGDEISSNTLTVSGLNILDELNNKSNTTTVNDSLSQKLNITDFNLAINQKADLTLVNTIVGLQTLINNNVETILPIESNGSSTKFRFRVGNNALRIEKFDNVGNVVIDDWVTVITMSLDETNLPVLMLGDLNIKDELNSKASIQYVDDALANVQPSSSSSSVLTNYVSPIEASLDGLDQYSLYRTDKTLRMQVKPPTQYSIKLSSASSITWSNIALVPDDSFTFETWVYSDRAGGAPTLLDVRGNGKSITINKDGGGRLQILSDDINLGLNINGYVPPSGQWIHIAVQNDLTNNIFRVYVNGDSTLLNPASGLSGWSVVNNVTLSISMSEGFNMFSNIRISLGAIYGISTYITPSLPLSKGQTTKFLVSGNTTNDTIQNIQGAFTGSVILEQMSDSLITETGTDGDIQVIKVTADDVRSHNLGITKSSDGSNLFSVIDETTLGGTTLDPVVAVGATMITNHVECTSLSVAGVPFTNTSATSSAVILMDYGSDLEAMAGGVPQWGLYRDVLTMKMRIRSDPAVMNVTECKFNYRSGGSPFTFDGTTLIQNPLSLFVPSINQLSSIGFTFGPAYRFILKGKCQGNTAMLRVGIDSYDTANFNNNTGNPYNENEPGNHWCIVRAGASGSSQLNQGPIYANDAQIAAAHAEGFYIVLTRDASNYMWIEMYNLAGANVFQHRTRDPYNWRFVETAWGITYGYDTPATVPCVWTGMIYDNIPDITPNVLEALI